MTRQRGRKSLNGSEQEINDTWERRGEIQPRFELSGFVQSARDIPQMIAIDGCSIGCAKACLEKAHVPLKSYLVLTDLGLKRTRTWTLNRKKSLW